MSRPIPGRDRRIGDTSPNKPTLDIFLKNWAESPLYSGLFPNTDPRPTQISKHAKSLEI